MLFQLNKADIKGLFEAPPKAKEIQIDVRNPRKEKLRARIVHDAGMAILPREEQLPLPDGVFNLGGIPVRKGRRGIEIPDLRLLRPLVQFRPWQIPDWKLWFEFTNNDCKNVPAKTSVVTVPVTPHPRMLQVSKDCARVFTVNHLGEGCVTNVVSESVDGTFTVTPNPSPNPPYPANLPGPPIVHPFAKGGINHKYQRLYVPASFNSEQRIGEWGGFYVAVVDIDPTSASYLDTIAWIDCGWIPEEVSFTEDENTGVIANYMQGTATIFRASDGAVLAAEVDLFPGAGAGAGGPLARSVRCANVPGLGNRAFATLTTSAPDPGMAIIDLDSPGYPVTNFTNPAFGFIDGVGITPEQDRVLLVQSSRLHVVRVDTTPPVLERSIDMPSDNFQAYFGGIDVRPSGNLCYVATGGPDATNAAQGTALTQVGYISDFANSMPTGLPDNTWDVRIESFGDPLKPHIFTCSTSGAVSIIPC